MSTSPALAAPSAHPQLAGLRVLIAHEWFYTWAGGERCVEQMLQVFPNADLLVGIMTPQMRDYNAVTRRARETWVGRIPGARARNRWFLPLHALAFANFDTRGYDLVISSSHAFEKFIHWRRGPAHLCYCYTPPRFLWAMTDVYGARASLAGRLALRLGAAPWRALDRRAAARVQRFVSISKYISQRVDSVYGVSSDVVYPPVEAKPEAATSGQNAPFLLTISRLAEYKRVDLLVKAAERLGLRLVIAGDGPERKSLERIAGPHTEFVGRVSEAAAGALLRDCSAFLFAAEEDFGIAPLEANAHGRPVVCFGRGATTETIVDGATGIFFHAQTVEAVTRAAERCLAQTWDPERLRANAARFFPKRFREAFAASVVLTLQR
ncbi:MAG TPA: glycosyltransferase [Gemmatimonadaceae bacterium]|nr:glycosyltransferase [Gemmatimonadaceae bacterium]